MHEAETTDPSNLINKAQYDNDKRNLEKMIEDIDRKITDIKDLVKETGFNAKVKAIETNCDASK